MGVLTAAGAMNSDATPMREPDPVTPEREEPEAPDAPEPDAPPPEEKGEFVPMAKIHPKKATSRRGFVDGVEQRLKEFADTQARERQASDARHAQEVAHLRGQLEAMQRQPPPQQAAKAPLEDPDELHRQADDALSAGKYDEWKRLNRKATLIEAEKLADAKIEARFNEFRQQQPQPMRPEIQFLMNQHKNVAMAGERGARAVMLKDQELGDLYNVPPGPDRIKKAFEIADQLLGSQQRSPAPQYSHESASALSGVPTGRSNGASGGNDEVGVTLTALQKEAAKAAGLSPADYVRWSDPGKYIFNKR